MFASIVSLGVLALLGLSIGAVDGSEVYTTIDADFHHLGDHFVPTYQPQSPEGTEYSKSFEAPAEVESPAIKMWIRGQVPADQISIDFVKLFVNGELLAYLNEYAMGSGTINEVDDEVEIEVSIEEGILLAGTNELSIVTGWGHSSNDRDDIMFWNIRLVRARPLSLFEPYSERYVRLGQAVDQVREKYGFGSLLTVREKMLGSLYNFERGRGFVLKTASLTQ